MAPCGSSTTFDRNLSSAEPAPSTPKAPIDQRHQNPKSSTTRSKEEKNTGELAVPTFKVDRRAATADAVKRQRDDRAVEQRTHLPHFHRRAAAHMILLASLLSSLECMVRREGRPWRGAAPTLTLVARQQSLTTRPRSCSRLQERHRQKTAQKRGGSRGNLRRSKSKGAALAFCLVIRLCQFRLRRTRFEPRRWRRRGGGRRRGGEGNSGRPFLEEQVVVLGENQQGQVDNTAREEKNTLLVVVVV